MTSLHLSMPLVTRDLAQMSGRKSTYRLRFGLGAILAIPALVTILTESVSSQNSASFGAGLASTQFLLLQIAIYALLPALTASAISVEKENRTLQLLLLTDLTPTEIVLQKYLSRLIPMGSLLLLSAPVFAVAYAYGGTTVDELAAVILSLAITCIQVAAIAILCSAICRNTTSAVVATYLLGAALYYVPYLLAELDENVWLLGGVTRRLISASDREAILLSWVPPHVLSDYTMGLDETLTAGLPVLVSSFLVLVAARQAVVRSLTVTSRPLGLRFREWDAVLERMNLRFGSVKFGPQARGLPDTSPVAWRETNRLGMGRRDHLIRLILIAEIPVAFLVLILSPGATDVEVWSALAAFTWLVCGFILLIQATLAFPSERTDHTLDILLVTPLRATEIVDQKFAALGRLFRVLMLPTCTVLLPLLSERFRHGFGEDGFILLFTFAAVLVAMRTLMFVGMYCGARFHNKILAIACAAAGGTGLVILWTVCLAVALMASWFAFVYIIPALILLRMKRDSYLTRTANLLRPRGTSIIGDVALD